MRRTARELAQAVGANLEGDGEGHGSIELTGVAAPERASSSDLIFVDSARHVERAAASAAQCVVVPENISVGNRVEIHSGAVLGADGFGYAYGEGRQWKFPQTGIVEIADDVEIGANATIDRGSLDDTRVAEGVKLDNLVHVGHNVQIGAHTVVAAQTGISGSSKLGHHVIVGGQAGFGEHCTLEDGAVAGAQAGIPTGKTIRSGQTVWGTPAREIGKFKEAYAWYARLPELAARIKELEAKLAGN